MPAKKKYPKLVYTFGWADDLEYQQYFDTERLSVATRAAFFALYKSLRKPHLYPMHTT